MLEPVRDGGLERHSRALSDAACKRVAAQREATGVSSSKIGVGSSPAERARRRRRAGRVGEPGRDGHERLLIALVALLEPLRRRRGPGVLPEAGLVVVEHSRPATTSRLPEVEVRDQQGAPGRRGRWWSSQSRCQHDLERLEEDVHSCGRRSLPSQHPPEHWALMREPVHELDRCDGPVVRDDRGGVTLRRGGACPAARRECPTARARPDIGDSFRLARPIAPSAASRGGPGAQSSPNGVASRTTSAKRPTPNLGAPRRLIETPSPVDPTCRCPTSASNNAGEPDVQDGLEHRGRRRAPCGGAAGTAGYLRHREPRTTVLIRRVISSSVSTCPTTLPPSTGSPVRQPRLPVKDGKLVDAGEAEPTAGRSGSTGSTLPPQTSTDTHCGCSTPMTGRKFVPTW